MNTSIQIRRMSDTSFFRWMGRSAGVVLFVIWTLFVVSNLPREELLWGAYLQAAGLAIVFAGYLAGWWNELIGGVTTIVGTAAYFAVCVLTTQLTPGPEVLLFAVPGICYLLAFAREEKLGDGNAT